MFNIGVYNMKILNIEIRFNILDIGFKLDVQDIGYRIFLIQPQNLRGKILATNTFTKIIYIW